MKKKQMTFDTILNIIAYGLPLVILQVIILPIVGNRLGEVQYGQAITLISFASLVSVPLGAVLNNIRLLKDQEYDELNLIGDFNYYLLLNLFLNILIIGIGGFYYRENLLGIVLLVAFASLNLLREYIIVAFRLILDYKGILINNILLALGYLVGLGIFFITGYWQWIYLVGNLVSIIYIVLHSDLLKEKVTKTPLFKETGVDTFVLLIAMLLNTSILYADKLILYPLLGATAVSIYYSASIIGKMISMIFAPMSSVFLSYVIRIKHLSKKKFLQIVLLLLGIGAVAYLVLNLISGPLMQILYPSWYNESMQLIPMTNLAAIISAIITVINPFILRFKSMNWQLALNGVTLIIYVLLSLVLYYQWGLLGFTTGIMLANAFKFFASVLIFLFDRNDTANTKE